MAKIYATGQDVLVAAAAGSGKTAVLVERIIQKILRDGIDVDRLLVVTFTNLSAREMKHRVDQRIQEASIADPANAHLKTNASKFIKHKYLHFIVLLEINSTAL